MLYHLCSEIIYFLIMKPTYEHTVYITGQFLMSSYMVHILPDDGRGCQNMQEEIRNCTVVYGACGGTVGWGTVLQAGRSWVRFPVVSLEFFIDITHPVTLWPWGWLSPWKKWVQGIFPRGWRWLVHRADLTTFMCRLSWNLWALTFWNPRGVSRPVMGLLYLFYCCRYWMCICCIL